MAIVAITKCIDELSAAQPQVDATVAKVKMKIGK
jgi:hypothetical protein